MIVIIEMPATAEQMEQMLSEHKFYIKVAIDIERRILAGSGNMHYDCEQTLLLGAVGNKIFGLLATCPQVET